MSSTRSACSADLLHKLISNINNPKRTDNVPAIIFNDNLQTPSHILLMPQHYLRNICNLAGSYAHKVLDREMVLKGGRARLLLWSPVRRQRTATCNLRRLQIFVFTCCTQNLYGKLHCRNNTRRPTRLRGLFAIYIVYISDT